MRRPGYLSLIILILSAVVWYSYYKTSFSSLVLNDAMDYASISRNILRGEGLISSYITPLGLANIKGLPHHDLWRAPFWPIVLSFFLKFFGNTDQAVAIGTGFFYIIGSVMVFLLGRELFDETIGITSAFIYIFSAQNLDYSVSGMTEAFSVFMMLLTVYLLVASWTQNKWGDVLAGLAAGLFYLTRYNALLFIPFMAVFLWFRRHTDGPAVYGKNHKNTHPRFWKVVRFLTSFVIVISPWLIRNYLITGNPFFSLQKFELAMFTSIYPEYRLYTMMDNVNVADFIKTYPQEIWAKVAAGWNEFWSSLLSPKVTGVDRSLFILFCLSIFIPFENKFKGRLTGVKALLAACFVIQLSALLLIHFIYRLFFIFFPFYIIFGVAALVWFLKVIAERFPKGGDRFVGICLVAMTGFFIISNLPVWGLGAGGNTPIKDLRESVKAVTDMSSRKQLILSNDGHLLAWYGDRYAAKLPFRTDMITQIEKLAPVNIIYLSGRMSWNAPEVDDSWRKVFWGKPKELYDFRLVGKFDDGSLIYVRR